MGQPTQSSDDRTVRSYSVRPPVSPPVIIQAQRLQIANTLDTVAAKHATTYTMSTSRGHISRLKFSAITHRAQQMTTSEPGTKVSLRDSFERFSTCVSSRGEALLYWSQWPDCVASVSRSLLCAPVQFIHDKAKG